MATSSAYFGVSFGSVVRGFHVYKAILTPVWNVEHSTQQEHVNREDQYAVAIINNDVVVGHLPRELSQTFEEARFPAKIIGRGQMSPLLQGGMEIPCIYTRKKEIGGQAQVIVEEYGHGTFTLIIVSILEC